MAKFTQEIQPVQAPSYLGASKEPSRADAMATADKGYGTLFNNLGTLFQSAAKGADESIKEGIRTDWQKAVQPLLDETGGNTPPEDIPGIAGTGARGARYTAASGIPGATDNLGLDQANVPPALANTNASLQKLKAAYDAGHLSQSYFDARVGQISKNLRSQYPGYEDYVDQLTSSMYGVQTANQLRKSTLTDLISMQAATSSAANKLQTQYHSDNAYIQELFPGMTVDQYAQNKGKVDVAVGAYKGSVLRMETASKQLALDAAQGSASSDRAERLYTDRLNLYVSTKAKAAMNSISVQAQDLQSAGANADPKTVAALVGQIDQLKTQIVQFGQNLAQSPLSEDSTQSLGGLIKSPDKIKSAQDQAVRQLDVIRDSIASKDFSVANSAATILKMRTDMDSNQLMGSNKSARALAAMRKAVGDQTTSAIIQMSHGKGLDDLADAYLKAEWLNTHSSEEAAQNPPRPISSEIATAVKANDGKQPGKVAMTALNMHIQGVMTSKDLSAATRHAQAIFGDQTFFPSLGPADQRKAYLMLTTPEMSTRMAELGKTDGATQQQYTTWVERNASLVAKESISQLQSATEFNRYSVTFDPKLGFRAETKPEFQDKYQKAGYPDPAQALVNGVNQVYRNLQPALVAQYGDKAPAEFLRVLEASGYNPRAPQSGTWYDGLGSAVVKSLGSAGQSVIDYLGETYKQLINTQGQTGKQSSITLDEQSKRAGYAKGEQPGFITAQYESGGDYALVHKDNKGWAYGKYQFNSIGSLSGFFQSHPEVARQFSGLRPGTEDFNQRWEDLAKDKNFERAQDDYFLEHAQPAINRAQALGYHLDNPGVHEAVLSGSIQHGRWTSVLSQAARAEGFDDMTPQEQIVSLYKARAKYVMGLDLDQSTKAAVLNRYRDEVRQAIRASNG